MYWGDFDEAILIRLLVNDGAHISITITDNLPYWFSTYYKHLTTWKNNWNLKYPLLDTYFQVKNLVGKIVAWSAAYRTQWV